MPIIETPAFEIRELNGRRRHVSLTQRALPYRPLTFEGEQRVTTFNPPGNPEGYGTVMGPTEGDTTVEGYWKDKYLNYAENTLPPIQLRQPRTVTASSVDPSTSSETAVSSAVDACRMMDSIRREGQLLEVTWGFHKRRGYLKKFQQKWHNNHDCEWSMTFSWTGQGSVPETPEFSPRGGGNELAPNIREQLSNLVRALDGPRQMAADWVQQVNSTLANVASATQEIEDLVGGYTDTAASPLRFYGTVRATLGSVATGADNIRERAEAQGWTNLFDDFHYYGLYSSTGRPVLGSIWDQADRARLDAIDPDAIFKAQLYQAETISDARRLRDAAEFSRRLLTQPAGAVIATHVARENEDLRDVALIYYGSPDNWRELMLYNGLDNFELYPGQNIAIPRLQTVGVEDV